MNNFSELKQAKPIRQFQNECAFASLLLRNNEIVSLEN